MNLRKSLQRYTPEPVSQALYRAALKSFQLGIQVYGGKTHAQVWARNSYRLGNWTAFQSDIDLSVWMAREPKAGEVARLVRTHQRVKKVFPFLGEINLYIATDLKWVELLINAFELERDPQLAKKITTQSPLELRFHAASFLLRMLESDIERVLNEPEGRRPKWDAHFARVTTLVGGKECGIWEGFPERSLLRGIVELIVHLLELPSEERQKFTEQLELYFQSIGRDVPTHLLAPLLADEPYLWAAFPQCFCFRTENRPVLEGALSGLAQAQLSWEFAGMLAQHRLWKRTDRERAVYKTHLGGLMSFYQASIQKKSAYPGLDTAFAEVVGNILRAL
jgi:hypothetical protein